MGGVTRGEGGRRAGGTPSLSFACLRTEPHLTQLTHFKLLRGVVEIAAVCADGTVCLCVLLLLLWPGVAGHRSNVKRQAGKAERGRLHAVVAAGMHAWANQHWLQARHRA